MLLRLLFTLLLSTAWAQAAHRVALLVGSDDSLATALESHGFVLTRTPGTDQEQTKEALHTFLQGVPTKGVALVHLAAGNQKPLEILQRLHTETGATLSIVLAEQDGTLPAEIAPRQIFALVPQGFAAALALRLKSPNAELIPALEAVGKNLDARLLIAPDAVLPLYRTAASPPTIIQPGKKPGQEWVNAHGILFCWCPRENNMGFWMAKYEATKREFDQITRKNPRDAIATLPNHPRDAIHYDDIRQFVDQLNFRERFFKRLPPDWEYALPSEDQWAHACTAGTSTRWSFGDDPAQLANHANFADQSLFETGDDYYHYADRSGNDGHSHLAEVGSYPANPWGLHDLYGNLWEWTSTFPPDPQDPQKTGSPLACGGSWVSLPHDCTPTARRHFAKRTERDFIGFRLVLHRAERTP